MGSGTVYKIRRPDGKYLCRAWRGWSDEGSIFTTLSAAKTKLTQERRSEYVPDDANQTGWVSRCAGAEVVEFVLVEPAALKELNDVYVFNAVRLGGVVLSA